MCNYTTRVSRCGHYKKSLSSPCNDAKKRKVVCSGGEDTSSTTGGWCLLEGCDKKPNGFREGPGVLPTFGMTGHLLIKPGGHKNGGFNADDVDWSEYTS